MSKFLNKAHKKCKTKIQFKAKKKRVEKRVKMH